jgi:hypothetical protein
MHDIVLNKFFDRKFLDYYEGIVLYHEIKNLLDKESILITIDFDNIKFNNSFIQCGICKHLQNISKSELKSRLDFDNLGLEQIMNINQIIDEYEYYWNNPRPHYYDFGE